MTREIKLALILGSALVLVVGVLISDHLSGARQARIAEVVPVAPPVAGSTEGVLLAVNSPPPRVQGGFQLRTEQDRAADESLAGLPLVDPTPPAPAAASVDTLPADAARANAQSDLQSLIDMARKANVELEPVPDPEAAPVQRVLRTPAGAEPPAERAATREHLVRSGDTLWKIAERYYGDGNRFGPILEANRDRLGPNGELREGVSVRIPDAPAGPKPAAQPASRPAAQPAPAARQAANAPSRAEKQAAPAKPRTYTVRSGDTLAKIAEKTLGSGKRWREILELNRKTLKNPDVLPVGATLRIPPR